MNDREAMERAIALAWGGWGRVGSNPLVGALVLNGGELVGEGYHAEFGGPHGEVAALRSAGERARGADLVVTLEPCAHQGKTPPCTEAIAAAGIKRVVFATRDSDPRAQGGAEVLKRAGVEVESGVLEEEVRAQNALFFHRHAGCERPFVAVKLAFSLDARIADSAGRSRWVTGEEARGYVHWLRAGFDSVGVGAGTARADDPQLTARGAVAPLTPPARVVFDRRAELSRDSALVRTAREQPVIVVAGREAPQPSVVALESAGVTVLRADGLGPSLAALKRHGLSSLLVEGGATLAGRLVHEQLVDRLYLMIAPVLLGERALAAFGGLPGADLESAPRWRTTERRALGGDTLLVVDRP